MKLDIRARKGKDSTKKKINIKPISLNTTQIWVVFGIIGIFLFMLTFKVDVSIQPRRQIREKERIATLTDSSKIRESVLPFDGVTLPIRWGNLGKQMVESGVIDYSSFENASLQGGGLSTEEEKLLSGEDNKELKINEQDSRTILNLLWAFGLSNKNPILEEGPMQNPQYGGIGYFASTGGWSLAKGNAVDHYSKHEFVTLTPEQQARVENVSKNIYRPCCNNPAYFPDCNHGMAMLGLLELLASQNLSEAKMYETALIVNSYWFPNTYLTIAKYFGEKGVGWSDVNPKEVLGPLYSSASGYSRILAQVKSPGSNVGQSCGV